MTPRNLERKAGYEERSDSSGPGRGNEAANGSVMEKNAGRCCEGETGQGEQKATWTHITV